MIDAQQKLLKKGSFLRLLKIKTRREINLKFSISCLDNGVHYIPVWIDDVKMFDDDILNSQILALNEDISKLELEIKNFQNKLLANAKLKSILYTSGEELVKVVFEILEKILDIDLSSFTDIKNEDFLVNFDGNVLVGEIKGVSSNIKSSHVSQVDVHLQNYLDNNAEDLSQSVKALLIINHQRQKNIIDREPVHQKQIDLAVRNNCLIIETYSLLLLFEEFINNEISTEEVKELLFNNTGLFNNN